MFTKQEFTKSAVLIWIVASVVYIGWDTWNDYKIRGVQQAYQAGINDYTKQLFDRSQAGQCKAPFDVTLGDTKMSLIDVKCLQQQPQAGASQPGASQPGAAAGTQTPPAAPAAPKK